MSETFDQSKIWDYEFRKQGDTRKNAQPRYDYLLRLILKYYNRGDLLEIGFGDGYLLKRAFKKGFRIFGIDISSENVKSTTEVFRREGVDSNLSVQNVEKLEFDDLLFNIAVASEVIEHLNETQLSKAVKEIHRVLKSGGIFIGTVPAYEKIESNIVVCPYCGNKFHRWGHFQSFDEEEIKKILFENGFKVLKVNRVFILNKYDNIWVKSLIIIKKIIASVDKRIEGGNLIFIAKKK